MRQTPIYYYSSSSGLVRSFAERLGRPVFNLADREHRLSEADGPWVLLTPSYKSGNDRNDTVPEGVLRFLASDVNRRRMVGVIGSGNRNFGAHYQRACRVVAARSGRPVLFEFELSGTPWDVEDCRRIMAELDAALAFHGETPHGETPSDETPSDETPPDETPCDETPKGRPVD